MKLTADNQWNIYLTIFHAQWHLREKILNIMIWKKTSKMSWPKKMI